MFNAPNQSPAHAQNPSSAAAQQNPPNPPPRVIDRVGRQQPFDASRIERAIAKAARASGEFDAGETALLSTQVVKVILHRRSRTQTSAERPRT